MVAPRLRYISYVVFFLTLFAIDYASGNGLVTMFQKFASEFNYIARDVIMKEQKNIEKVMDPISVPKLFIEILIFTITFLILKKYQRVRGKDRIDQLLQESKEALQQTNDYLEKWKLKQATLSKYSYFDILPSDLSPLKLEIPVLNMAIIETRNSARNQTERGDAEDSINISDSIVFSITSLIDDDEAVPNFVKEKNDVEKNEQLSEDLRSLFRSPVEEEPLYA